MPLITRDMVTYIHCLYIEYSREDPRENFTIRQEKTCTGEQVFKGGKKNIFDNNINNVTNSDKKLTKPARVMGQNLCCFNRPQRLNDGPKERPITEEQIGMVNSAV